MKDSITLYGITEEIKALENLFEMEDGEFTTELEILTQEMAIMVENKTDSCIGFLQMQKDRSESFKNRITAMQKAKKAIDNKIESYENYLVECVKQSQNGEFVGKFGVIKNRKPTKIVSVIDENKIPMEFLKEKTEVSVDKKGIKDALKAGTIVDGCELIDGKISLNVKFNS